MGDASGKETALKYTPKVKTYVQVVFAIVASSAQIIQITVAPSAQAYGTFSLLVLASLAVVIVVFDYKGSESTIEIRLLKATRKGAIDALEEFGESLVADAESAQSAGSKQEENTYRVAAKLAQRQVSMLKKVK